MINPADKLAAAVCDLEDAMRSIAEAQERAKACEAEYKLALKAYRDESVGADESSE